MGLYFRHLNISQIHFHLPYQISQFSSGVSLSYCFYFVLLAAWSNIQTDTTHSSYTYCHTVRSSQVGQVTTSKLLVSQFIPHKLLCSQLTDSQLSDSQLTGWHFKITLNGWTFWKYVIFTVFFITFI